MDEHGHDIPNPQDREMPDDVAFGDPLPSERSRRFRRQIRSLDAAAIAGVAYSVLAIIGVTMLSRFPDLAGTEAETTAWFDDSTHQTWLIVGLNLVSISAIAFLWFVAVIRRRLGDLEDRFFGTVFLGSSIVYVAIWLVGGAALAAPAVAANVLEGSSVSGASASLAGGIGAGLLLVVLPRVQAVFIFTTSTLILRSRILPRWLAIVGFTFGSVLFLIPLLASPIGLGFPIWVFVVSIVIVYYRPAAPGGPLTSDPGHDPAEV